MPASKIQDEAEVLRWFEEGRTYAWMVEEYRRKYNLVVVGSMFGNFRQRRGLQRRITRDDDLIPWHVQRTHRWDYAIVNLRAEARRRAGLPVPAAASDQLTAWKRNLATRGQVVDYDPEQGFTYVDRRPGVDTDLIRVPERKSTKRLAAD